MKRSAVFCVPSRKMSTGAEEGFGLVFAEAQAAGLPVVSYANGGIPEAVAHGETGLLAADGDRRQLATNLAALLTDRPRQSAFSQAASTRARRLFNLPERTAELEKVYMDVVRQRLEESPSRGNPR
jgi:glycosyltransferase involved in cell wall biosynthesis